LPRLMARVLLLARLPFARSCVPFLCQPWQLVRLTSCCHFLARHFWHSEESSHLPVGRRNAKKFAAQSDEDNMATAPQEPRMPFGKHRGKPVSEVFRQDRSYLAWFCDAVDGNEVFKQAIRALPGFSEASGKYFAKKQSVPKPDQEFDLPNMGVDPSLSREDLDRLWWEILHPPVEE